MFPTLVLRILEIPFISLANGAGIYFSISSPIFSMAGITILGKTLLKYKYEYLKKKCKCLPRKSLSRKAQPSKCRYGVVFTKCLQL